MFTTKTSTITDDCRWQDTEFLVQATSEEKFLLWQLHAEDSLLKTDQFKRLRWEDDAAGRWEVIGELDGRPINLSFWWSTLNGVLVCFYECVSEVVDWKQIDEWVNTNVTVGPDRRTNTANFYQLIHYVLGDRV